MKLLYGFTIIPFISLILSKLRMIDVIYIRDPPLATGLILSKPIHGKTVSMKFGAFISKELVYQQFVLRTIMVKLMELIELNTIKSADIIFVPSNSIAEELTRKFGVNIRKIDLLPAGVDVKTFTNANEVLDDDFNYVGYIGSLVNWQGVDVLVKAMKYVQNLSKNTKLLIVGDGQNREELISLIKKLKINAKIIYEVEHNKIPGLLKSISVFVIPRRISHSTNKVLPIKFLEACAASVPIVVSKTEIFENLIKHGLIKALLFEPENSKELAAKIVLVLFDLKLRNEFVIHNYKFVMNYDYEIVAKQFVNFLFQKTRGTTRC